MEKQIKIKINSTSLFFVYSQTSLRVVIILYLYCMEIMNCNVKSRTVHSNSISYLKVNTLSMLRPLQKCTLLYTFRIRLDDQEPLTEHSACRQLKLIADIKRLKNASLNFTFSNLKDDHMLPYEFHRRTQNRST